MMKHRTATAKRVIVILLVCIAVFSVVTLLFYFFGQKNSFLNRPYRNTVTYNGEEYVQKDIVNFLIMGIDNDGKMESSASDSNKGKANNLILISVDRSAKAYRIFHINCDTVTDIKIIDEYGEHVSTEKHPVALAHTYFDGLDKSCKNTKDAVSGLFGNIEIDYYISMNMPAIQIMSDHLGGIPITFDRDYTAIDPAYLKGETVSLSGERAVAFLLARSDSDGDITDHVDRQRLFFDAFLTALASKSLKDVAFLTTALAKVSDYTLMNCNITTMARFMDYLSDYTRQNTAPLAGEALINEGVVEFHVDQEKLQAFIFEWFYAKAELK